MPPLSRSFPLARLVPLVGALVLAGCKKESPAPQEMPPAQVTVVTLKPQRVQLSRELPGRTSASLVAEVRPQVNGIIKKVLFTEGGKVKAGQALYQLDDATYRADHASAEAALDRARATVAAASADARRSAELLQKGAASQQENERAITAFRQAEAEVKVAEATLHRAAVMLGYARISSPIGGRIGISSVTQGALVTANQPTPLAVVQQLDPLFVDLTQSSSELLQLRQAMASGSLESNEETPVKLLLEDGTEYPHPGKLSFTDVTVDPSTGSFALRVVVPNPDSVLLPGMYLRANLGSGAKEGALLVPQQGITRDPKGNASAMVVGQDGKVEVREVKTTRTVGDKWLVDSGLAAGDQVIVEGLQKIGPGAPVQAVEAGATASATPPGGAQAPGTR